jgi:plastocyanin
MRALRIIVAAAVGAGLLVLAACGSTTDASAPAPLDFGFGPVAESVSPVHPVGLGAQLVTIRVLPPTGAQGENETTLPANFAVRAGAPVKVVIYNYTKEVHTFTAPELGVSRAVPAATGGLPTETTFTFVPQRYGVFEWRCNHCGIHMTGKVYAIVTRTA